MGESVAGDDERRSHVNTTQTMTRKSEQLRAVFLAALMVISVFGMTVAFAGSAAAATNSISLSDELVQDGEDIYVNGTVDANGTVVAFVDENGDGEFNTSDDGEDGISGEEVIQNHKEDGSYSIELTGLSLDSGTYDVYVFQEEEDEDYAISNGDTGERHAELQVDADEPTFGNETPEDGSALTSADEIEVPLKDANTSVAHVSATVQNSDNEITTYEIDPDEAYWDGVGIEDGDLVITPGKNDVPALTDGKYTVSVTAKDEVGNQNSTDFTFTVDSTKPQVEFSNVADDLVTNKENKSITVKLKPGDDRTLNDSTAELTIDGADDYEETLNSSFEGYTSSDNAGDNAKFEIEQDGDIPPLPDGEVTLTASVEDDAGNSVTESLDFEVDLESPSVETVELTDDEINSDDSDEKVHVTFDEANVQSDSVSVNVNIDGSTIETATGDGYVNNSVRETVVVPLDLSKDGYSPVENDSAVVNVTAATDEAGNSLENPDADASNTTFAIDTDGPTVTLEGSDNLPNGGTLSGLVNVTTFITDQSDVDQRTVTLEVGGQDESIDNEDAVVDITNSAENLSTQDLPDGTHTLIVTVEDDAGNTAQDEVVIDLDNGHAVDVSQSPVNYMPGLVTPVNVGTSDVTVSDVFETSLDAEEMTYEVNGTNVSSDYTITPEDNRGDTVNVSANGHTVTLEFAPLVGAESVSGDEIDIGVEADSELDELNVTVEATDDYTESEVRTLTIGNFDKVDNGSTIIYTTTVDDLRDGSYSVTIEDGSANLDGDTTATVDDEDPHITDADVVSAGSGHTFVKVEFNEPVDGVSAEDFTFTGDASVRSLDGDSDQSAGYVYVELDEEAQTAGDQSIEVVEGDYAEDTADSTNAAESVTVDTIEWQLTDELNVVSIPAEAGEVGLSSLNDGGPYDLDENHVDSVMTYEDGEWLSYNPSTGEGDLQYLEGGEGYIVKMDDDETAEIDIEVQNVAKDEKQAYASQSLETGWNLIGAYQEGPQPVDQAFTPLPDSAEWSVEKGYTNTNVKTLEPGQGYWLFTNEPGYHVPVDYTGMDSEKPSLSQGSGVSPFSDANNDGTVSPQVTVSAENAITTVLVDAPALGIDDKVLTTDDGSTYDASGVSVDYAADFDGIKDAHVTYVAIDANGNLETLGKTVDVKDRSGTVSITDADFSDLTEGDTANVTVATSYKDGVESPKLVLMNSDGAEVGNTTTVADNGDTQNVDVQLSKLDNKEDITAKLIDAAEDTDAIPNSTDAEQRATDTEAVSGLEKLAYVENSPSTIVGTGDNAIQTAENSAELEDGETLYVEKGDYSGVDIDKSGISITAAPGLSQSDVTINEVFIMSASASGEEANGVTISGFTIQSNGNLAALEVETGGADDTNNDLVIENNTLVAPNDGVALFAANMNGVDIQNNTLTVEEGSKAIEMAYIGGEAGYGTDRASTDIDLINNVFEGTVDRDQPSLADGNAIEFEGTGDSEISGNNFSGLTFADGNTGVKVLYSSTDVIVEDNEGIENSEVKLTDQGAPAIASATKSTSDSTTEVTVLVSDDDSDAATFDSGLAADTVEAGDFNVTDNNGDSIMAADNPTSIAEITDGSQSVEVTITLDGNYSDTKVTAGIEGSISDLAGNTVSSGTEQASTAE